ncbi:flagellar FlbD family protein [Paenarthrobacter ilicis]|uniref:Flagellar protein FlbD n=1 Tax=Paenarthrobacter ilicis TaxID=43665 RepID=A0ABX0TIM5_9MICC|nr:flagellar FlbD family protein [Paenarthrobacter ilicis]MBM7792258.1 flagellar protein FlbD [Paenarthrobacter ilicis]NIJ00602.1 flagellar protein FlbD [Paenarthrobacter ilicis]
MIVVTRLNGTRFAVNPDILERIHESPDTHLVTLDGAAYVVRESLAEVVELIANYRAGVLRRAHDLPAVTGYPLSLVRSPEPEEPREPGESPDPGHAPEPTHPNGR